MLTLSYAAGELLAQWLSSDDEAPDDAVVRVIAKDDGIGLVIDKAQPGDETFAHAEKTVLVIDEQVSRLLENKRMDVAVTGDQSELTLTEQEPE